MPGYAGYARVCSPKGGPISRILPDCARVCQGMSDKGLRQTFVLTRRRPEGSADLGMILTSFSDDSGIISGRLRHHFGFLLASFSILLALFWDDSSIVLG